MTTTTTNGGGSDGDESRAALVLQPRPGVNLEGLDDRDTVPPTNGLRRGMGRDDPSATRIDPPRPRAAAPMATAGPISDDARATVGMAPVPMPEPEPDTDVTAVEVRALPDDEPEDTARDDAPLPAQPEPTPSAPSSTDRATLAGVLRDRDDMERELLTLAAIIGERFWFGALRSLVLLESPTTEREDWGIGRTDDRLNGLLIRLQQARLVSMRQPSAIPGELEFAFVDPADRAALIRQLPLARRERLHRGVAQWLDALQEPDRARWAARRAWHWEEGRRGETAALAYAESAVAFVQASALGDAARMYDRAAALLDVDQARTLADVQLARARLLSSLGWFDEAARAGRAALRAAQILSDDGRGGRALIERGLVALHTNGVMAAADCFSMADERLAASDDREGQALAAWARGRLRLVRGGEDDVRRAIEALEEALGPVHELRGDEGVRVRLLALPALAEARLQSGDGRTAERIVREVRQLADRARDIVAGAVAERIAGDIDWARGRDGSAVERWERALARAVELDLRPEGVRLRVRIGEAAHARRDDPRAEDLLRVALDEAELLGSQLLLAQALRGLSRLGDLDAEDRLRRAADIARHADANHELAQIALARGDRAAASRDASVRHIGLAALREARERLEASGNRALLARVLVRLAMLTGGEEGSALRARAQKLSANL